MSNAADIPSGLRDGWADVIATRDAAPEDCPCREITGPFIEAWQVFLEHGTSAEIDRQWENLRAAQAAQRAPGALARQADDFTLDVRSADEFERSPRTEATNIPVDQLADRLCEIPKATRLVVLCATGARAARAVSILRGAGYRACNGHDSVCPVGPQDPALGADVSALGDLFRPLVTSAGQGAGQVAASEVEQAVPRVSSAIKGQIPPIVSAASGAVKTEIPSVAEAAGGAVKPIAQDAGSAAGKAAAESAKEGAFPVGLKIGLGVAAVLGVLGGAWALTRKKRS